MKRLILFFTSIAMLVGLGSCSLSSADEDIYKKYVGIWQGVYMADMMVVGHFYLDITPDHTYKLDLTYKDMGGKSETFEGTVTYKKKHLVFEGDINESFETMGSVEESDITLSGENIQLYNMYR